MQHQHHFPREGPEGARAGSGQAVPQWQQVPWGNPQWLLWFLVLRHLLPWWPEQQNQETDHSNFTNRTQKLEELYRYEKNAGVFWKQSFDYAHGEKLRSDDRYAVQNYNSDLEFSEGLHLPDHMVHEWLQQVEGLQGYWHQGKEEKEQLTKYHQWARTERHHGSLEGVPENIPFIFRFQHPHLFPRS